MSLTSYQAAPPRVVKLTMSDVVQSAIKNISFRCKIEKTRRFDHNVKRGWKDPCRHRQLVGSRIRRVLVSKKDAPGGSPRLVRAAFQYGGGQFHLLLRSRSDAGTAMVRYDSAEFCFQRQIASTPLLPFNFG